MKKVVSNDIGAVLDSITRRSDAELFATSESELSKKWYFQWDETASIEWNIYEFSAELERFRRQCRKWEEHHNGTCCVVERVRDKYLMPKIRAFMRVRDKYLMLKIRAFMDEMHLREK